ncbi:MAG TPA: class I SAM-dependent methyltransferase [Actinocrinis sp.]|jgi:SAM-dependent methyltransferase
MEHTETDIGTGTAGAADTGSASTESPLSRHGHHDGHGSRADHDVDPAQFFTREYWDERYADKQIWSGNPNALLVRYAADLAPGTALDVGCGEGADALWLASRGWSVVGADVSTVALQRAAQAAERSDAGAAERITWQQADVVGADWAPPQRFDLVSAQFVHLPTQMRESLHRRLAAAVRPGGTLLVVGHHPSDLETSVRRPQLPGMFATGEEMAAVLDPEHWDVETAVAQREAADADGAVVTIHDAVVRAVRRR